MNLFISFFVLTGFDATDDGNRDQKDNSQTTAIVVSVLVIAFVVGVLVFLAYKHRARCVDTTCSIITKIQ
jgi:heme/copper-type cytochrome/quinol oxidase subunit 2